MFGYLITQIDSHITQHRTNHYVKFRFLCLVSLLSLLSLVPLLLKTRAIF
jgi:hypothetical protein